MTGSRARVGAWCATALIAWGVPTITSPAMAADWRLTLSGTARVTATDNGNLAPSGQQKADVIGQITPQINASRSGARLRVNVNYAPSAYVYVNESNQSTLTHTLFALASLEAVENFFFVDARATASQQFISPFGPQPVDLPGSSDNTTQTWNYGLSPYIRGRFGGTGITYLARSDNTWSTYSNTGSGTTYRSRNTARVDSAPARIGWALEYINETTRFDNASQNLDNNTYRARLIWNIDPQFRVFATGGYQDNNYALSESDTSGPLYGGGFEWRPTERTALNGWYESTVFGPTYLGSFSHRTPLSAWSISAQRNTTTYPQQADTLPPGNTAALLDTLLLTQFPDPVQRQAEVNRIIATRGLPAFQLGPQAFFSERVYTLEQLTASAAIIGVRNVVTFTVFASQSTTVSGSVATAGSVTDPFLNSNAIDRQGASIVWNARLTPISALNAIATRTESETREPSVAKSTTDRFVVTVNRNLSPKTQGSLGLRYVIFDSNVSSDYTEAAVFATVSHQF
jgi:uncharacterized protein (PEP-CTERM system associated)